MSSIAIPELRPVERDPSPTPVLRLQHGTTGKPRACRVARLLLGLAGINCAFQIVWFWRLAAHNINYDAISYLGIAQHLRDGDFLASLNGYWSPLMSWCVAATAGLSSNLTLLGRLFTIGTFLLCLPLLYVLALHLWRSPRLAALAVFWFTMARGIAAFSVYFIGADFLLTALVLSYFILLLRCLRAPKQGNWIALGVAHSLAFLAKAIAMPWLAISTALASVLAARFNGRRALLYSSVAMAIPLLVWLGWGLALKAKYGFFTPGYQARWNLLDEQTRDKAERDGSQLSVFLDTSRSYDPYLVVDNMFPGSGLWLTRPRWRPALRLMVARERGNLPKALKEVAILLTPGGVLGIILVLVLLARQRKQPEAQFAFIVVAQAVSLVLIYCMLVFDARYVLPLIPLLIALAVPFVVPKLKTQVVPERFPHARVAAALLLGASVMFLQMYPASPFRKLTRDYQSSCYDAAAKLRKIESCKKLVVIGRGPYPDHGVGWEAGLYASHFARCGVVGFSPEIPDLESAQAAQKDLLQIAPDAILIFGSGSDARYEHFADLSRLVLRDSSSQGIFDPQLGEVGTLVWKAPAGQPQGEY